MQEQFTAWSVLVDAGLIGALLAVGTLAWTIAFRPGTPTAPDILLGVVGGVGEVFGTLMLMRGLAAGAMHVG